MTGLLGLLKVLAMTLAGVALGLGATWMVVDAGLGFGAIRAGAWQAWPKAGTLEIDPYTRARMARSGELPLGLAEGLSLAAAKDDSGEALHPNCTYRFTGRIPPARYWTLTLTDQDGYLTGKSGMRRGMTSSEILRRADGQFDVAISREARPGNWLPIDAKDDFLLVLRLYDTAASATAAVIEAGTLPALIKEACL